MSALASWQQLIFRAMAFRRTRCGSASQIPGCWVTRPLRSGESAAARPREVFLGRDSLQDSGLLAKPLKGPILERNGGSAIRPTYLSLSDVKKNFKAYVVTMSMDAAFALTPA
jgi:hypothetical protein